MVLLYQRIPQKESATGPDFLSSGHIALLVETFLQNITNRSRFAAPVSSGMQKGNLLDEGSVSRYNKIHLEYPVAVV